MSRRITWLNLLENWNLQDLELMEYVRSGGLPTYTKQGKRVFDYNYYWCRINSKTRKSLSDMFINLFPDMLEDEIKDIGEIDDLLSAEDSNEEQSFDDPSSVELIDFGPSLKMLEKEKYDRLLNDCQSFIFKIEDVRDFAEENNLPYYFLDEENINSTAPTGIETLKETQYEFLQEEPSWTITY